MSVPPDQLKQLMAGGPPPGPGAMPGPSGAPMSTPQEPKGEQQQAFAIVEASIQLLMSTLPMFGPMSEEAEAVTSVVSKLQKKFGKQQAQELVPAQLQMLMQGMTPSPEQQAMGGGAQQKPPGMPGLA